MKAIATLRNYANFAKEKGRNVQHLVDAIDEIEAYIHALEYHKQQENKHRNLLAKLIIHYFWRFDLQIHDIADTPIQHVAHEFAERNTPLTLENMNVFANMLHDQSRLIIAAAYETADELAEINV